MNASTSDVVATTSIEALAMGKWLVCADHPCNAFAAGFPNTLVYHTSAEFCQHLQYALDNDPVPMDDETLRSATQQRLCKSGSPLGLAPDTANPDLQCSGLV